MIIKTIIDEDFSNYKEPSLLLGFYYCNFKCGKENCHNKEFYNLPNIETTYENIVERYLNNTITSSIIFSGMEPFESYNDMVNLIKEFRKYTDDTIVIYTGYNESEVNLEEIKKFKNIIIKFGRFVPNQTSHYDDILGVNLASDCQYAKIIS